MTNNKYLCHLLVNSISIFFEGSEEFKDSDLKEGILNSTNLVLNIMLLGNKPVSAGYFRNQLHHLGCVGLITLNNVLEESHAAKKHSMTFFLETGRHFRQEFINVLGNSFNNFDRGKDSFLSNVS